MAETQATLHTLNLAFSMDITPLVSKGIITIKGYGNGGFSFGEESEHYQGNLLLLPDEAHPWNIDAHELLSDETNTLPDSLQPILARASEVDLLILGAGSTHIPNPSTLQHALRDYGISIECMSTGAACRTYNILLTEGRQLAAALIAV